MLNLKTRRLFQLNFQFSSYEIYGLFLASLIIAGLLIMLVPSFIPGENIPRAQPILLQMASENPQARVNIIVQKQTSGNEAEGLVTSLGGRVTTDLHIINGFGAELPAQAIPQLARSQSVRWVSLDAPMIGNQMPSMGTELTNNFNQTIGANKVWPRFQGDGIGIAIVDSGITPAVDFYSDSGWQSRIVKSESFYAGWDQGAYDLYGHGSHVAGIAAGKGNPAFGINTLGVAPKANLLDVKISDDNGNSNTSIVVRGLQWVYDNRLTYNIKVVNISLNSSVPESYNVSPLCAAAEVLWFNGITVVVSAGNGGSQNLLPPANDPFVITVGATNENNTPDLSDDTMAPFSAYGKTVDGFSKPDLVAPGKDIVSILAMPNARLAQEHPANVVNWNYFRMSGTSVSAPMVSGAVALLLQSNPYLSPNQVKYRLMQTARPFDSSTRAGAGYLNIEAAINGTSTQQANVGLYPSRLLNLTVDPNPNNNAANWSSANWSSANWSSANWSSANWSSTYWGN